MVPHYKLPRRQSNTIALGITQLGVWFRFAFLVTADLRGLVALAERSQHCLDLGTIQTNVLSAVNFTQLDQKCLSVFVELLALPNRTWWERPACCLVRTRAFEEALASDT